MHRSAGRVQETNVPGILQWTMRNIDGLPQKLLLRQRLLRLLPSALCLLGGRLTGSQKYLIRPPHQVAALLLQTCVPPTHFIPDAAEGVVGEELDDVARGEELVAHGELAGVARGGGGVAHGFALLLAVPVLVDPADGLVLGPEGERGVVDAVEQPAEGVGPGEEHAVGREAVEEDAEVEGELVEDGEEEGGVALVAGEVALVGDHFVELEAVGVGAGADDGAREDAALFGHAQGTEAVEDGEGLLLDEVVDVGVVFAPGPEGDGGGALVVEDVAQGVAEFVAALVEAREGVEVGDGAVGLDAVGLQEGGDLSPWLIVFAAEQPPGVRDEGGQAVASGGVEGHTRKRQLGSLLKEWETQGREFGGGFISRHVGQSGTEILGGSAPGL